MTASSHTRSPLLHARRPEARGRLVAFAAEGDSGYAVFDQHGQVRGFGLARPAPGAFLDYLEDRLAHPPTAAPPPRATEDEELSLAERLLA